MKNKIPHIVQYQGSKRKDAYMLLSPSANRTKSWACGHCENWIRKDISFCIECFWWRPEKYNHTAENKERRIVLTFTGNEIEDYNILIKQIGEADAEQYIKNLIKSNLKK